MKKHNHQYRNQRHYHLHPHAHHSVNSRVGVELWGSRAIGEFSEAQAEGIRSKRKVVIVDQEIDFDFDDEYGGDY